MKIWISFVCLVCTIASLRASEPFDDLPYNQNIADFKLCTIRVILPSGAGDGDVYNLNYNLDDLEGKNHPLTFNFVRHSTPECPNQWTFSISLDMVQTPFIDPTRMNHTREKGVYPSTLIHVE